MRRLGSILLLFALSGCGWAGRRPAVPPATPVASPVVAAPVAAVRQPGELDLDPADIAPAWTHGLVEGDRITFDGERVEVLARPKA
ncbi:MAG: hypothetical protein ACO32Z_08115, partial [Gemmatimonadaceae bacterium]